MKFSELNPGDVFGYEGTLFLRTQDLISDEQGMWINCVDFGVGNYKWLDGETPIQDFPHGHYESEDPDIAELVLPTSGIKIIVDADRLDELDAINMLGRQHCWKLNTLTKLVYRNEGVDHRGQACYRPLTHWIMQVPATHVIKFRNDNKLDVCKISRDEKPTDG